MEGIWESWNSSSASVSQPSSSASAFGSSSSSCSVLVGEGSLVNWKGRGEANRREDGAGDAVADEDRRWWRFADPNVRSLESVLQ